MKHPRWSVVLLALPAIVGALVLLTAPVAVTQAQSAAGPLPPGPGVELIYAKCTVCHPIQQVVASQGIPAFLWDDTIDLMKRLGLKATAEEEQTIRTYLKTYMGPEPPPTDTAAAGASDAAGTPPSDGTTLAQAPEVDGAAVFDANCSACHQPSGEGIPGTFPPLAGHAPDLFKADRDYLPQVILKGLQGSIEIGGSSYSGFMPPWPNLSEAEVAAVLNHVLTSWGNDELLPADAQLYTSEDVARLAGVEVDTAEMRQGLTLEGP